MSESIVERMERLRHENARAIKAALRTRKRRARRQLLDLLAGIEHGYAKAQEDRKRG